MDNFTILSILYILILGFCAFLMYKFFEFKSKVKELSDTKSKLENKLVSFKQFYPGRKGVIHNYGLTYAKTNDFQVSYEVEIIQCAEDKVKVSAYDYTSSDQFALDPSHRQGIIDFLNGKWVDKKDIDLIVTQSDIRDNKIDQILS